MKISFFTENVHDQVLARAAALVKNSQTFRSHSLHYTSTYHQKKTTENLKTQYYVQKGFDAKYGPKKDARKWRDLQKEVEKDFIDTLRYQCHEEQVQKETLFRKGQYFRNNEWIERARKMEMPKCKKYEDLNKEYRQKYSSRWG